MINFNKATYEETKEMIAMSQKELIAARDDYWTKQYKCFHQQEGYNEYLEIKEDREKL